MLDTVGHELRLIADHRQVARRKLRVELLRVESRWAQFAAWPSDDSGQVRSRNAWADHAAQLAQEADCRDMIAFIPLRRSQWAAQQVDARQAISFAEAALRVPGTSTRPGRGARCARHSVMRSRAMRPLASATWPTVKTS